MIMPALVEMRQIAKTFGPVVALNGVDFTVHTDEVVGLVGDNGAGKSTLMKILTGVHQPDAGEVWLAGTRVHFHSPLESRRNGIEMVYQDLGLAENLNAIANIFLGRELTRRTGGLRLLSEGEMERQGRRHLDGLQISLPSVFLPVERLSGGQRQSVAIAPATAFRAQLVIMDEPAASLAVTEAAKVLAPITAPREQRAAVVLIIQRLKDALPVADRFIDLNQGIKVGDLRRQDTTMEDVVGLIVGKSA